MNSLTYFIRKIFSKIIPAILFPFVALSQPVSTETPDLTGVWAGFIKTTEKTLPYEIAVSENNGKLSGYSYTTFSVKGEEQVAMKSIQVRSEKGNIIIEDDDLLYDNFDEATPREIKQTSTLLLKGTETGMVMTGKFKTKKTSTFRSLSGEIRLRKDTVIAQARLLPKLENMNLTSSLSFLKPDVRLPDTLAIVSVPPPGIDSSIAKIEEEITLEARQNVFEPKASPEKTANPGITSKPGIKKINVSPVPAIAKVAPPPIKTKPTETAVAASAGKEKRSVPVSSKPIVKAATTTVAVATIAKAPAKPAVPPPSAPPVAAKPAKTTPAPIVTTIGNRSIETIQTVYFQTDSLLLTLYDNGEVDGDTVSVILNGAVILSKQGLSTKPINKTVYITPEMGDSLQMIMYAENLGSIAPNTGLLIVLDGKDRYYIRFAGDLNKNAAIIFRKRKEG